MLTERAPAKVNLHLHVVGRRTDGYHLLDSLAVFPGAADRLAAEDADGLELSVTGPCGAGLAGEGDNLVLRAARALAAQAGVAPRARLMLDKRLPVASGIGGGSADAAATLRVLDRLWVLRCAPTDLHAVASGLGADVPACVRSRPVIMSGVGEQLGPAPALPSFGMVLVNPGVPVATPAVFKARTGPFTPPAEWPGRMDDAHALASVLRALRNDLEPPAVALCPAIADVLAWIAARPGCLLARMSGSGATCFGLFADGAGAGAAATAVPPSWWAWGGLCAREGFTDGGRSA